MSKIIRAAAVQIAPVLYSREGTVDKVVKKILELGKQGVQFATSLRPSFPIIRTSRSSNRHLPWVPSITSCSNRP
jgi:hypothetical protein